MQKIQKIISLILTALGLMKKQAEIITPVFVSRETVLSEPTPLTNTEKLCRVAISYLGKDASPKDLASDGLGCAESISNIIHEVFPDFQSGILGTDSLKYALNKSPRPGGKRPPITLEGVRPGTKKKPALIAQNGL